MTVLVLAHRGDTRGARENTLEAFSAALAAGAAGIETDLRLAACGTIVCVHDRVLADCRPVASLTHGELESALGCAVPTIEQVLSLAPAAHWNLELKEAAVVGPLVRALEARAADRPLLVTSFDHVAMANFARATRVLPCARAWALGVLVAHRAPIGSFPFAAWQALGLTWFVLPFPLGERALVAAAGAAGLAVGFYDLVGRADHEAAVAWGARLLVTDDIPAALSAICAPPPAGTSRYGR